MTEESNELQRMQRRVEARLLSEIFFEGRDARVYTPHMTAPVNDEYERFKRTVVILKR